ncbi:MAG: amino acid adenylation domain-containing protein, partial [bacterium]|nr:amino acid adenylation domain-containing protein [bacterium]
YINTILPLLHHLEPGTTFKQLLLNVRQTLMEAIRNQNYPVELLPEQLGIPVTSSGGFPLFDVSLVLENIHDPAYMTRVRNNIEFSFHRHEDHLETKITTNAGVFDETTPSRLLNQLTELLSGALQDLDKPLDRLELQSEEQKKQLLTDFNNLEADYPHEKTIHGLFEEQVERNPDRTALVGEGQLSYSELNRNADRLAGRLIEEGVGPETIVAVMVERSLEMIVGLLGILKAGGAYLPMDPGYPEERVGFMLRDSGTKIVVTNGLMVKRLDGLKVKDPGDANQLPNQQTNLSYIIYTSGTTGKPKGVMIEHRNVVRLLFNDKFQFDFDGSDVWTLFHSYCFDFSVWEMYGALLNGGKLLIVPGMIARDPLHLVQLLKRESVTVLNQTPSAFYQLADEEARHPGSPLCLKYVIFGGEALNPARLRQWRETYPRTKLVNMFGITETTVHVTYKEITEKEIETGISNIGKPIPTLSACVLDHRYEPVPVGVPGQLYVGGAGVARGYLNRPQLTAERFQVNPHVPGQRLYDSGDLARVLEKGELEYIGRVDHQVQLKGFRIETGEIEAQLSRHPGIRNSFVTIFTDEHGNAGLCAYIVPVTRGVVPIAGGSFEDTPEKVGELRDYLSHSLPHYMVPSYFIPLERIPLTPNGKLDRKALPSPVSALAPGDHFVAPRDETETRMLELWQQSLEVENIGVTDSYFNIGGDSIKAIHLVNLINEQLDAHVEIPDLYRHETIETLALWVKESSTEHAQNKNARFRDILEEVARELEDLKVRIMSEHQLPEGIEDIYPMSDIEKGMTASYSREPGTAVYHDQTVYQVVYPDFDFQLFRRSVQLMADKHGILRTCFNMEDYPEFLQLVYREVSPDVEYEDISTMKRSQKEDYLGEFLESDRQEPFNVKQIPWRLRLFNLGGDEILVVFVCHHAILDGWSVASLATELNNIYARLMAAPSYRPGKLKSSYKDFIIHQQAEKRRGTHAHYWTRQLSGYQKHDLTEPVPEKEQIDNAGLKKHVVFPGAGVLEAIRRAANQFDTGVKHLCFAAYFYVIDMLSYENDTVVGLVTNNRPQCEDGEKILGCFLNSVPFRLQLPAAMSGSDYIRLVDDHLVQLKQYDRLPLYEITRLTGETSQDRNPIFDTIFNYIDFHVYERALKEQGGTGERLDVKSYERTNMSLVLSVSLTGGVLGFSFSYDGGRIRRTSVEKYCGYFQQALDTLVNAPDEMLRKDNMMAEEEKHFLLSRLNNPEVDYPADKTIHRLFEEQVERTPGAIASVFSDYEEAGREEMTYRELNEKSRQLAHYLMEKGVTNGSIVALLLEPSLDMIVAVIAVLKAGGGYLPIDQEYPEERVDFMLKDSAAKVIVTDGLMVKKLDGSSQRTNPPANLAYIIYTSGTTGKPKGVMVEHRNVVRLLFNDGFQFDFNDADVWTMFHSYCFDFSVWEMYGALLYGGQLVLFPRMTARDPGRFLELLALHGVTVLNQTPSAFYQLVSEALSKERPYPGLNLKYVIFGGEALNPARLADWKQTYPRTKLVNMFGITETTVHVTYKEITGREIEAGISNIGAPIPTLSVYVLDPGLNLQPVGIAGQCCVGGEGVARGYLNRVELTSRKFVENPYKPGERLYLSGDLVRVTDAGEMEYLGRIDDQVQLRGFRVELGEIESCLLRHEQVRDAAVAALEDEEKRLYICAYIVPVMGGSFTPGELRDHLAAVLPDYMVPSCFVQLEKIPVTPNGKVDKKALPAPVVSVEDDHHYTVAATETEHRLVEIWQQALTLEKIGVTANYFNMGGDSIKAIRLLSTINSNLNTDLKIPDIYENPTIRGLAGAIDKTGERHFTEELKQAAEAIETLKQQLLPEDSSLSKLEDFYPMSDIEKGMVFVSSLVPGEAVYHDQFVYQLTFDNFDPGRFKSAMELMVKKHSILRTSFNTEDYDIPLQMVHEEVPVHLDHQDISSREKTAQEEYLNEYLIAGRSRPFDVTVAPLWRMGTFLTGASAVAIVWQFHHAILDGWSNASLMTELNNTYLRLESEPRLQPPGLKNSYKDFIIQQAVEKNRTEVIDYWKEELNEYRELNLAKYETGNVDGPGVKKYNFEVSPSLLEELMKIAGKHRTSVKHLCLSAFLYMLNMFSYENDLVAGLVTNARPVCEDGDKILGCFLNSVPVRVKIPSALTCSAYIQTIERKMQRLKQYERMPLYEIARVTGEVPDARNPVFDVLFNYVDFHVYDAVVDADDHKGKHSLDVKGYENVNILLALNISATGGVIMFSFAYDGSSLSRESVTRYSIYFQNLLNCFLEAPYGILRKDIILPEEEKHRLLENLNVVDFPDVGDRTIHECFEKQAVQTPDYIALIEGKRKNHITYGQLNMQADGLAKELNRKGVRPGDIVALMMDRTIEMAVAIFGILKAGGAYLPIEPDAPEARVDFMLKDSGANVCISDDSRKEKNNYQLLMKPSALSAVESTNLAYIIYTSGTTGRPKGVMIEHRGLVNFVCWRIAANNYTAGD